MTIKAIAQQIEQTSEEIRSLEDYKFIAGQDGESTEELESQLLKLTETLEGLRNEYQAELRNAQNMDLGKWIDETVDSSKSITVTVDGVTNLWLEAMCYATICQACQFRWSSAFYFTEQAREKMLLSPENTDAYDRFLDHQTRKEEIERLWLAAERSYFDATDRMAEQDKVEGGNQTPPKLYNKSHDKALADSRNFWETRSQASKASREKLEGLYNDIDENQRKLFIDALPSVKIY